MTIYEIGQETNHHAYQNANSYSMSRIFYTTIGFIIIGMHGGIFL